MRIYFKDKLPNVEEIKCQEWTSCSTFYVYRLDKTKKELNSSLLKSFYLFDMSRERKLFYKLYSIPKRLLDLNKLKDFKSSSMQMTQTMQN